MDGKFNEVEMLWIEETLDQHGEHLSDILFDSIERLGLIDQENLINSISYNVGKQGDSPVLHFSFLGYGRAIEIRYHKRSDNSKKFAQPNTAHVVWGVKENRLKKKKDTRWYSKNVYGSINRLIQIIMYELDAKEVSRLKGILSHRESRSS